jgi:hypothetical protein
MTTHAMDLMREERWAEAERLLEQSYELVPAPTIAILQGDALVHMGELRRAEQKFQVALQTPLGPESPAAYRQAAELAASRLSDLDKKIPRLTLVVEHASAARDELELELNGESQSAALLGIERRVDPGKYEFVVKQPGGRIHRRVFNLTEGANERVVVDLKGEQITKAIARGDPAADESSGWFDRRRAGWIGIGVGAAGLTTGAIAGLIMANKNSKLEERCTPTCPASMADDVSTFETARTVSLVGFGAGLLGMGVGATLLLTDKSTEQRVGTVRPYATARVVGLRGKF